MTIRGQQDEMLFPVFGSDQMLWADEDFRNTYSLWQICHREPKAVGEGWLYDYAVFLRTGWAIDNGFLMHRDTDDPVL